MNFRRSLLLSRVRKGSPEQNPLEMAQRRRVTRSGYVALSELTASVIFTQSRDTL